VSVARMRRKFSDEGVVLVLGPEWSARISAVANMCAASRDFPLCISGVIEPAVGFDRGAKAIADGTGHSGKKSAQRGTIGKRAVRRELQGRVAESADRRCR
jgi:hypothetical protein